MTVLVSDQRRGSYFDRRPALLQSHAENRAGSFPHAVLLCFVFEVLQSLRYSYVSLVKNKNVKYIYILKEKKKGKIVFGDVSAKKNIFMNIHNV